MQQDETLQLILGEIRTVKGELQTVNRRLDNLETEVKEVRQEVKEVRQEVKEVREEVKEVKEDVQEVKNRLIIMEHDHGKRIGAALDGYTLLYDISKKIREDVSRLRVNQEHQSVRVLNLEQNA